MIIKDYREYGGRQAVLQYSDLGLRLRDVETGKIYDDVECFVEFEPLLEETDILIERSE